VCDTACNNNLDGGSGHHSHKLSKVLIENEEGGAVDDDPATYTVELASHPGASVISIDTLLYQHIVCAVYGVSGAVADVADHLGLQRLQEAI